MKNPLIPEIIQMMHRNVTDLPKGRQLRSQHSTEIVDELIVDRKYEISTNKR